MKDGVSWASWKKALGFVLQVELMRFAEELDVEYDKKVEINNNS